MGSHVLGIDWDISHYGNGLPRVVEMRRQNYHLPDAGDQGVLYYPCELPKMAKTIECRTVSLENVLYGKGIEYEGRHQDATTFDHLLSWREVEPIWELKDEGGLAMRRKHFAGALRRGNLIIEQFGERLRAFSNNGDYDYHDSFEANIRDMYTIGRNYTSECVDDVTDAPGHRSLRYHNVAAPMTNEAAVQFTQDHADNLFGFFKDSGTMIKATLTLDQWRDCFVQTRVPAQFAMSIDGGIQVDNFGDAWNVADFTISVRKVEWTYFGTANAAGTGFGDGGDWGSSVLTFMWDSPDHFVSFAPNSGMLYNRRNGFGVVGPHGLGGNLNRRRNRRRAANRRGRPVANVNANRNDEAKNAGNDNSNA